MKFLDRISGDQLTELPEETVPGRYCVVGRGRHNHHTDLEDGDLVLDDGTGYFRIGGNDYRLKEIQLDEETAADAELSFEAIHAIATKVVQQGYKVSPMLPMELAEKVELEEVERMLTRTLEARHLHAIADRPRQDLRYDDMVAPVERVRKLASGSLSHLTSHSDCWQRRTLTGVVPRKILARFSEDDYAIYENRLFKRLLDRLERHLTRRLALLKSLNERLATALDFQKSELTHFELRIEICTLWGEASQVDLTGKQLNNGREAQQIIERQLHQVRGLKQRGLYRLVPVAAVVPTQVYRTNILNHDAHYRHLPPLWESLANDDEEKKAGPDERLAKQKGVFREYSLYVGLVIRRALEKCGLSDANQQNFSWSGRSFNLINVGFDWSLVDSDNTKALRFIPMAWFGDEPICTEKMDRDALICVPRLYNNGSHQQLTVTPLDLYVVEKVGAKIDEWLWHGLIKDIGVPLGPLPGPVKAMVSRWPENFVLASNNTARLVNTLGPDQIDALTKTVHASVDQKIAKKIMKAVAALGFLASCSCGGRVNLACNKSLPEDFSFKCESCSKVWSVKSQGAVRRFTQYPKANDLDESVDRFMWCGRRWLDFEVIA